MLSQPRTHLIIEGSFEGVWDELDRASGCSKHFSKDLCGVTDPLHSKRVARRWCPENTKGIGIGLESEANWLLEWTRGTNGNEIFPEKLPYEDCQHVSCRRIAGLGEKKKKTRDIVSAVGLTRVDSVS